MSYKRRCQKQGHMMVEVETNRRQCSQCGSFEVPCTVCGEWVELPATQCEQHIPMGP